MPYTKIIPFYNVTDCKVDITFWNRHETVRAVNSNGFLGSRTGEKGVDWKAKKAAGRQAGTAFESDRYMHTEVRPGTLTLRLSHVSSPQLLANTDTVFGIQLPNQRITHLSTSSAEVEAEALKKLYNRIRSEKNEFQGMTFLGELRETLHMIRRPAEALLTHANRYVLSLEKKKREVLKLPVHKRRAQWEKAVAGSILELNFGWAPLISDVKSAAVALGRFVEPRPIRTRISATASQEVAANGIIPNQPSASVYSAARLQMSWKMKTTRTVCYRTGFNEVVTTPSGSIRRLQELMGFTPHDFVPTIYELLPWSWLADYFSNLGDIVSAASTDVAGLAYVVRTEIVETEQTQLGLLDVDNKQSYYGGLVLRGYSGDAGLQTTVRKTVSRTLPTSIPLPPLVFTHPGESFKKMANMLSVLVQRRKGLEDLSYMPTYVDRKLAR